MFLIYLELCAIPENPLEAGGCCTPRTELADLEAASKRQQLPVSYKGHFGCCQYCFSWDFLEPASINIQQFSCVIAITNVNSICLYFYTIALGLRILDWYRFF